MSAPKKLAVVLPGGGARSAYQAGVLAGLNELIETHFKNSLQFKIICGISGGAVNSAYLAANVHKRSESYKKLWDNWASLGLGDIMDIGGNSIFSTALKLVLQLGAGGFYRGKPITQILSTDPLTNYLISRVDFRSIRKHIRNGDLQGLAITSTHYGTGTTVTFFDGHKDIKPWMRSHRIGKRLKIGPKHILASAAIPVLFPPVKIHGSFYGDGAMRMASPLSPAIHLGTDKVLAIGLRYYRSPQETYQLNNSFRMKTIQLADISGTLLNSLFLDAVDSDLERMMRINQTLRLLPPEAIKTQPERLRMVPVLALRPSKDLGTLAVDEFKNFSWVLKHFLRGLGATENTGSDLISYLAFEKTYTTRLLELGYTDVMKDQKAILEWFAEA